MSELSQVRRELALLEKQLETLKRRLGDEPSSALPTRDVDVLVCDLGGQQVAFLLEHVDEVVPMAKLAQVPESPEWLLGVLTLRQQAVPVVDTSARLLGAPRGVRVEDFIVVGQFGQQRTGILVEGVRGVEHVEAEALEEVTADIDGVQTDYVLGYFSNEEGSTLLVDPARLVELTPVEGVELP